MALSLRTRVHSTHCVLPPGHSLAIGMLAENATATNTGTINSGLFIDKDGRQSVNSYGAIGMQGKGASTVTNDGIINQAVTTGNYGTASAANPWDTNTTVTTPITLAIGMLLSGDSTGVNNETINVVDGNANGASFGRVPLMALKSLKMPISLTVLTPRFISVVMVLTPHRMSN